MKFKLPNQGRQQLEPPAPLPSPYSPPPFSKTPVTKKENDQSTPTPPKNHTP